MEPKAEKKAYPLSSSEYKLLEEVGEGVSAIVYRALCIPFNEVVAVKALDLERCNSNLDDIRKEAQTMSLINHPNVMKAYCSFVVDHSLWVVMPFMAGGSCLHIMKSAYPDGFEEPIIATFLKESLKALEYLHCHGHIHRDVKAGNILVGSSGSVKLGDFGVSACMFDTGDRQRSRNTFVGTPCWMAPEVMEQVHGYDFKADIWSFGITALELAHGHAPFAKYPPMKVLLMTLQNAPPGLDYERDKKFSKSFKEMIAMCLVKDPAKRPTAEKLVKHSFFKQARSTDYIVRSILAPLLPLWERVKELKKKDAARLAQKKMPYGEQEEKSQNEYKRGVSCWNFDVDDLKAQAALIQDDGVAVPLKDAADPVRQKENDAVYELSQKQSLSPQQTVNDEVDIVQIPVTIHSLKAEITTDAVERVTRVQSGPLPSPLSLRVSNGSRSGPLLAGKKEPKHIGRFDVFEDDMDGDASGWQDRLKVSQQHKTEKDQVRSDNFVHSNLEANNTSIDEEEHISETEPKKVDEKMHEQDESRQLPSTTLVVELVGSSSKGSDVERERVVRGVGRESEENLNVYQPKDHSFAGPAPTSGFVADQCQANIIQVFSKPPAVQKEGAEEKFKGTVIQKKGRFSVTHDVDQQEGGPVSVSRKNASVQTSIHMPSGVGNWQLEKKNGGSIPVPNSQPQEVHVNPLGLSPSVILPQLQNILTQTTVQHDLIVNLINHITSGHNMIANRPGIPGSKTASRTDSSSGLAEPMAEVSTDSERELLSQVADLQCRITTLVEEVQTIKLKNVQLERKLNAIYNKEEEERIRQEEAAREDG